VSREDELTLDQLRVELARREAEHGISSDEFYDRWLSGLAGSIPDPAGWYSLFEAAVLKGLPTLPEYVVAIKASRDRPRRPATRLTPDLVRKLLAKYEAERGMSSAEFYERYMAGLEGDSADAMEWTWLYEIAAKVHTKPSASRA
jgi:hypothetical protein